MARAPLSRPSPGAFATIGCPCGWAVPLDAQDAADVCWVREPAAEGRSDAEDEVAAAAAQHQEPLSALPAYFDSHCHLRRAAGVEAAALPAAAAVFATCEDEWPALLAISAAGAAAGDAASGRCDVPDSYSNLGHQIPMIYDSSGVPVLNSGQRGCTTLVGLGVHPWFAHRAASGWASRLEAALAAHPAALVGEIGLDLAARDLEAPGRPRLGLEPQMKVFQQQLAIAAKLARPVSVHLAGKVTGKALAVLQSAGAQLPPAIALHSYCGSAEMVPLFLRLPTPVYFGFSASVNCRTSGKAAHAAACIDRIPPDRLLLETDELHAGPRQSAAARKVLAVVATAKGWGLAEAAQTTRSNATEAFTRYLVPLSPPSAENDAEQ